MDRMKKFTLFKLPIFKILVIVVGIIIVASASFILLSGTSNSESDDKEAPKILWVSGNLTVPAGGEAIINIDFTDNVGVTTAILFYRSASRETWNNTSIINGTAIISIPASPVENWYYYIVIDDAAGNGPIGTPSADGSKYYTITVNSNSDEEFSHSVFIEESSSMSCKFCPKVSKRIHELYQSGKYNFYYVTLVQDNSIADKRLKEDYNLLGNPTVYIDGGYSVVFGAKSKDVYEDKIKTALIRDVPKIAVTLNVELKENTSKININGVIKNGESSTYKGRLKVYLTEIVSTKWQDYDGNPYQFALLEFVIDKDITVNGNSEYQYSKTIDASKLDPENLMFFAVVFNKEGVKRYSNPDDEENEFTAHFADAVAQASVSEEHNLPPSIGITHPKRGRIHILGREIFKSLSLKNTLILGRITISANASDDSAVAKVDFYLDDNLVKTCTSPPYEWKWTKPSIFRFHHTLKVVATDDTGKTSTATMDVIAFILL